MSYAGPVFGMVPKHLEGETHMERGDVAPGGRGGANRFGSSWAVWFPQLVALSFLGVAALITVDVVTHLGAVPYWAMPAAVALTSLGGLSLSAAQLACVATGDRATFLVGRRRLTDQQVVRMALRQMVLSALPLIPGIVLLVYDVLKAQATVQ